MLSHGSSQKGSTPGGHLTINSRWLNGLSSRHCLPHILVLVLLLTIPDTSYVSGVVQDSHRNTKTNQQGSASNAAAAAANATSRPTSLHTSVATSSQHVAWAEAAFDFMHGLDCAHVYFTTERECRRLTALQRHQVGVYTAGPLASGRLRAVLPDGGLSTSGVHDGYLTLDPYPEANFGHLVLVFHVTMHMQEESCRRQDGVFLQGELSKATFYASFLNIQGKENSVAFAKQYGFLVSP